MKVMPQEQNARMFKAFVREVLVLRPDLNREAVLAELERLGFSPDTDLPSARLPTERGDHSMRR